MSAMSGEMDWITSVTTLLMPAGELGEEKKRQMRLTTSEIKDRNKLYKLNIFHAWTIDKQTKSEETRPPIT